MVEFSITPSFIQVNVSGGEPSDIQDNVSGVPIATFTVDDVAAVITGVAIKFFINDVKQTLKTHFFLVNRLLLSHSRPPYHCSS